MRVMRARHCKRAYLGRPVARHVLMDVLRAAGHAPSTRNGQPWRVVVVSGAARDALARVLCAEFDRNVPPAPDYDNRPPVLDATIERRAAEAGEGVLVAKGIARDDAVGRRQHRRDNLRFHGAPVEMIFHLPKGAPPGSFLEMGFFVQNVMLALVACGLGSCPQYSVTHYADAIRRHLGLHDRLVVCGLAVGYPDETMPVNRFVPERADVEDYVTWHDQAP
ncbi:nitroreductase [Pendulispora brunnea]|uniref:Nitroreductase n=1 Tax=Pendulispora brunnea TaxID=2905690 RepID=A0ABZ2KFK2_9BACT